MISFAPIEKAISERISLPAMVNPVPKTEIPSLFIDRKFDKPVDIKLPDEVPVSG